MLESLAEVVSEYPGLLIFRIRERQCRKKLLGRHNESNNGVSLLTARL
jgi:hypothetical protein